ncbi:MAG: DUF4115 domain-containing protein [Ignavibacteria bacterium]|jgi:transcriptional regulator with XRE-family HTH domain|nr:DUF4115 domain-containing protein [Ignavibacteria bacterium]
MDSKNQNIKIIREKLGLTIEQVAEETNVRIGVIRDLENNNDINMPPAYIQTFVNELLEFYEDVNQNPEYLTSIKESNKPKPEERVKPNIPKKELTFDTANEFSTTPLVTITPIVSKESVNNVEKVLVEEIEVTEYEPEVEIKQPIHKVKIKQKSGLNKKRFFVSTLNLSIRDIIIYIILILFLLSVVYLVAFYDGNYSFSEEQNSDSVKTDESSITNKGVANVKDNELLDYFTPFDSLVLQAICKDTAWVKVVIDNSKVDEQLLTPGMKMRWTASEQIVLSTSNVGAVKFYKNDTLLPNLGASGTMVRNIVFKREGVANVNPLTNSSNAISTNDLHPNETPIVPSTPDTTRNQQQKKVVKKKKVEPPPPAPILDFSTPTNTKPPILR